MSSCNISYEEILKSFFEVAKRAGTTILKASGTDQSSSDTYLDTKKNTADLVTETDKAVEKLISTTLLSKYPTFKFMGEETYKPGTPLDDGPTFIVDPIDGTTNFVHGYPYVSVSLGFALKQKPVVGVVFNPFTGILYYAISGQGAWKKVLEPTSDGDWKLRHDKVSLPSRKPAALKGLDGTVVAVEWGSDRTGNNWQSKIKTWNSLGRSKEEGGAMVHSARCLGSAALNLCAVAEGHIDMYWEGGCWAWDVCAGWVVLTEAGGIMVDGNRVDDGAGWDIPITHRKYLAVRAAPEGQKEIVREFWSHIDSPMVYDH